ncbi:MAG: CRISPR-associated endonuclease Cas1 [Deltaproteobacteria bacterium]|nr:CRISPR-associated endonuclease Cas1 [Deltaproteobacteria bacterium]
MPKPFFHIAPAEEQSQSEPDPRLFGQFNLFTGALEPLPIEVPEPPEPGEIHIDEGISLVKTEDSSQLVLSGYGLFLRKKSERLLVKKGDHLVYQFPFFRLNEVVISSRGIAFSSDLIEELCERGVRVSFLDSRGQPYALLSSPMLTATVHARREQLLAFQDNRGLAFARTVVAGKISNQERLLRYFGKYMKKADPERFQAVEQTAKALKAQCAKAAAVQGGCIDEVRDSLMGIEGVAGRLYWEGVRAIIGQRIEFFGREHRGATDAVNSLLNYGYGILHSQVWGAVLNAGLEPFAGFLHVDRPGKPSLVLDMVEEFRQPVVDRAVIAYLNLGEEVKLVQGMLEAETRKALVERVLNRLLATETYQGKRYQVRSIVQMQARRLASFLRGEGAYKAFSFKW